MFNVQINFDKDGRMNLVLEGDLDIASVDEFRAKATLDRPGEVKSVFLDFTNLDFIDSTGVMSIVNVLRAYSDYNITFKIVNIAEDVYEVFELIGILDMFSSDTFHRNEVR